MRLVAEIIPLYWVEHYVSTNLRHSPLRGMWSKDPNINAIRNRAKVRRNYDGIALTLKKNESLAAPNMMIPPNNRGGASKPYYIRNFSMSACRRPSNTEILITQAVEGTLPFAQETDEADVATSPGYFFPLLP